MASIDLSFITSLKSRVRETFDSADEAGRRQLLDALRDLQYSVEPPEETMQRIIHQNLTIASVRVAHDLNVYKALTSKQDSVSLEDLAARNGADPSLLGRLLRHQASMGMISETGQNLFAANNITRNLSIPKIQSGIRLMNDAFSPIYQKLPAYLKATNYTDPQLNPRTPFQYTFDTDKDLWTFLHARAASTADFDSFMRAQRMSSADAFSVLDLAARVGEGSCAASEKEEEEGKEEKEKEEEKEEVLFVDIGGGMGQQARALRATFASLRGRVILQDLPSVVAQADVPPSVEVQAYDFWQPQPVKGARFYYLRGVLHDYKDKDAVKILRNVKEAMGEESVLLIDEMVLPDRGVDWWATQTDLLMMCAFGSAERTVGDWGRLVGRAGMEVRALRTYSYAMRLSVLEVVKKEKSVSSKL